MPRIEKSLAAREEPALNVRPGVNFARSASDWTPRSSICSLVKAWIVSGASWIDSSRLRAVTTISSRPEIPTDSWADRLPDPETNTELAAAATPLPIFMELP